MYNKRENITEIRKTEHGVEWYRERIVEMLERIRSETVLRKIYTVVKTHINILNEKEGG